MSTPANAQQNQYERTIAYANGNLLANCEECGKAIPVEFSLCDNCRSNDFDTCEEAGQ